MVSRRSKTLEELVSTLTAERDLLDDQISALRAPIQSFEHELILRYVLLASAKAAAEWANSEGRRLKGQSGERLYQAKDVLGLVSAGHESVPAALLELARSGASDRGRQALRFWD